MKPAGGPRPLDHQHGMMRILALDELVSLARSLDRNLVQERLVLELPEEERRMVAGLANLIEGRFLDLGIVQREAVLAANPNLEPRAMNSVQLLPPAWLSPAVITKRVE